MRKFSSLSTAPKVGNLVERKIADLSEKKINNSELVFLDKNDISLYSSDPYVFNELYQPCWINKKNLSYVSVNFLHSKIVSLNEYYDEFNYLAARVLYTLRIHYISLSNEESILYVLTANFENLIKARTLYVHDVQNLILDHANS